MKKNKGVSLIIAVFAMMLLAMLGWTLVILQSTDFEANMRYLDSERAFYLAEAGTQHGYRNLIDTPSWRDANPTTYYTLGKGEYIIKCEDGSGADAGYIVLTATGYIPNHTSPRATRIIKMRVTSFPWTEAIDAVHLFDWSGWWLQRFTTYIKGDIAAAYYDGNDNHTYNQLIPGLLGDGDYKPPPYPTMPLSSLLPGGTQYDRLVRAVTLPDIDMYYYKEKARPLGQYVSAPFVYVADYATDGSTGLRTIDISDHGSPTNPQLEGSYNASYCYDVHGYFLRSGSRYTCLALGTTGMQIMNVTTPSAPARPSGGTNGLYNSPGTAYGVFVFVDQNDAATKAYLADGSSGLRVVDMSSLTTPTSSQSYDIAGTSDTAYNVYVRKIRYSGQDRVYAYVAYGTNGLRIVEVPSSGSATLRGYWDPGTGEDCRGVYVRGKYAFVADGANGLRIIDVSDPTATPLPLVLTCATGGLAYNVAVKGNYAYVACGTTGLKVIDISNLPNWGHLPQSGDPGYPDYTGTVVATYDPDNNEAKDVFIRSYFDASHTLRTYAYVAYGTPGLRIIDVTNPLSPTLAGTYDTINANGVFLMGEKSFDGNYNNNKVWFTDGNIYIYGGNMNHTSLAAAGDIELVGTQALNMKAHVDVSANENFPCLASQDGSIICNGGYASLQFDGLLYTKTGDVDFNYYFALIEPICVMGYNLYLSTALSVVDYQDKYVGNPPSGFTSSATLKDWREL